jgi:L-alanine-DL-glutamate epimerase-like enolase superfamily enzyme
MRIEHIEFLTYIFRYPEGAGYLESAGNCTHRLTSLVRVHTDSRLEGVGTCYTHPRLAQCVVDEYLTPLLLGADPTDIDALWKRMYTSTRWFGRKGAAISALGALDIAFWDLKGKAAGKPIWALLGEKRKAVPAYASGLLWHDDLSTLEGEAARHWERGFRRMKMRLGRDEAYDVAAVETVLGAIGKEGALIVDGSMQYDDEEALRTEKFLHSKGVFWFEEPFAPDDIDSYSKLRSRRAGVPIAAGENEFGLSGFRELIRAGAIDIAQPDASRTGGISEVLRVAHFASEFNVTIAPHTWSDAVAVIANAHAVAASNNALTVEVDQSGNPFIEEMLVEPLRIVEGMLSLPSGSGLGVNVAWDRMQPYLLPKDAPVPPGNYSDMLFTSVGDARSSVGLASDGGSFTRMEP